MHCLETTDIVHKYANRDVVLHQISLQVPVGSIYGFLGPNGAGKTTTLRLILGLLRKQQGTISIFGKSLEMHRFDILAKVGSLIESPSLYDHLTANENLSVLQKVYQCPSSRIPEVLALVGLADTGKKNISQFSLGMKQRLGIAVALLHGPSLLILDEPTNGLDPNGIIEIRQLLTKLNREFGITIVVSSHLLLEIEKLVTHVGIIDRGRMVFQGTIDELRNQQQPILSTFLSTNDDDRALPVVALSAPSASRVGGKIVMPAIAKEQLAGINRQLVENGLDVFEIGVVRNDLETIFMGLIGSRAS